MADKILSIFIDESGDFGPFEKHNPYYLVAMVAHNQSVDISAEINKLDNYITQNELTKVITSVFNVLFLDVEVRKVKPIDYKLFQVADLVCTMERLALFANRMKHADIRLSKFESL